MPCWAGGSVRVLVSLKDAYIPVRRPRLQLYPRLLLFCECVVGVASKVGLEQHLMSEDQPVYGSVESHSVVGSSLAQPLNQSSHQMMNSENSSDWQPQCLKGY